MHYLFRDLTMGGHDTVTRGRDRMGYQPALDGLRAASVVAVLLYHAGFGWMRGGFFGVEVFFVVSGFLITALLREERARSGGIDLRGFWVRRARRLLPALFAVLVVTAVYARWFGTAEQASQFRRDAPWAIFYAGNWGQILGDTPYFAGNPPLLRHLWSLAVEEQWYLLWPLVLVAVFATGLGRRRIGVAIAVAAVSVMLFTWWISLGLPSPLGGPPGLFDGVNRTNFAYLSTLTRSGGLLLGAAGAFLWQPWRSPWSDQRPAARWLDPAAFAAATALVLAFVTSRLVEAVVYRWLLALVSVLSLVVVLAAVHPGAQKFRLVTEYRPLVVIGRRSYGLYLWSWPISVAVGATSGSVWRFALAMAVTGAVTEASFRWIEEPVRRGALETWWRRDRRYAWASAATGLLGVSALVVAYTGVKRFDLLQGDDAATFDVSAAFDDSEPTSPEIVADPPPGAAPAAAVDPEAPDPATNDRLVGDSATGTEPDDAPASSVPPTSTVVVDDPVPPTSTVMVGDATTAVLAVVGDSTARALALNAPDGIDAVFPTIFERGLDGCGVYDEGRVVTRAPFNNDFSICDGWQEAWGRAAVGADVTLVVIGAWEVFDLAIDDDVVEFRTPRGDEYFTSRLREGIDAVLAEDSNVALLEIACMRPIDAEGAGVPPLPERGDDARVGHLNQLMRRVADEAGPRVRFVDGPDVWCSEPAASDLGLRWDGVHVYGRGANLIFETIASEVLDVSNVIADDQSPPPTGSRTSGSSSPVKR